MSFERVLAEVKAKYVVGLTATPQRRDGHHPILNMQVGPVRFAVDAKSQAARRPFEHKLVVRETRISLHAALEGAGIQDLYAALSKDRDRNDLIFNDVVRALEEKRSPVLLTERRDDLEHFAARLRRFACHLVVLHGGMKPKERRERIDINDEDQIVAVCSRGKAHQRVPILDLPLPSPPPNGAEWIEAFRRWARGG